MKTTLNFDDALLRAAKRRAAEDGETLTRLIERALQMYLHRVGERAPAWRFEPVLVEGERPPRVDLDDRDRLHDHMDGDPGPGES